MKQPTFGKAPASASAVRFRRVIAAILLGTGLAVGVAGAGLATDRRDETVRVMSRNLYHGVDFSGLLSAGSLDALFAAAGEALVDIRATRPANRAAAVAREIARNKVDLVGLQEATIIRTGTLNDPRIDPAAAAEPETSVESDGLQVLLKELRRLGEPFQVVAIVPGLDAQLPAIGPGADVDARITVNIAIIARSRSNLKLSNIQTQGFLRNLTFTAAGVPLVNSRGWASVDVEKGGRKFRFATTHLEADHPGIRSLQAIDMIAGAGNTDLPLVFVGDFNVSATTVTDMTYGQFLAARFVDAWTRKRPSNPGLTCCHLADLSNPTSATFDRRIDLVLFRGAFQVEDIGLVGEKPSDRILPPLRLWPSDHAGVVATLRIPRGH